MLISTILKSKERNFRDGLWVGVIGPLLGIVNPTVHRRAGDEVQQTQPVIPFFYIRGIYDKYIIWTTWNW